MDKPATILKPVFTSVEPVLPVKDILKTVTYWEEILGFANKWTWGDPPNHGGVSKNDVGIQFTLNHRLAEVSAGHSIWIKVEHLDRLYAFHQEKGVEIAEALANMPWGMAQYTIREINGYYVSFSSPVMERGIQSEPFPEDIRITSRPPTLTEYKALLRSVGWTTTVSDERILTQLSSTIFAVVAEHIPTGNAIGCALLIGDNVSFYYLKDVMIHPDWQGKRVGTAVIQAITQWMEINADDGAIGTLFTGENLERFYQQTGFSKAFGMMRVFKRNSSPL